jgi:hypothetical protein
MNITNRIKAAWLAFKTGNPATGIQTIKLDPNDALLVQTDRILSLEQTNKIKAQMDAWLQGKAMPVGMLDGGMTITVIKRKHMGHALAPWQLAEQWERRARRRFKDAESEKDLMGRHAIEHSAMCYFNAAHELREALSKQGA